MKSKPTNAENLQSNHIIMQFDRIFVVKQNPSNCVIMWFDGKILYHFYFAFLGFVMPENNLELSRATITHSSWL